MSAHVFRIALVHMFAASPMLAGGLDPPGTPASTPGPEPRIPISAETTPGAGDSMFRIATPGSYYLTGNLFVGASRDGIEIAADNVTLDLNGFAVRSVRLQPGELPPKHGVVVASGHDNIAIRNGTISGMDSYALRAVNVGSVLVEDVLVSDSGTGIDVGPGAIVSHCIAQGNDGAGFILRDDSLVTTCVSRANASTGIALTGNGILAIDNVSDGNGGTGLGAGIFVNSLTSCCRVEGNLVRGNDIGIQVAGENHLVVSNTARDNSPNYQITGIHAVGPIIGPANPITETSPWANFSF